MKILNASPKSVAFYVGASFLLYLSLEFREEHAPAEAEERSVFQLAEDSIVSGNKVDRESIEDKKSIWALAEEKPESKNDPNIDKEKAYGDGKSEASYWQDVKDGDVSDEKPGERNVANANKDNSKNDSLKESNRNQARKSNSEGRRFSMSDLVSLSEGSIKKNVISGSTNYASGSMIKKGSKYLGIIDDPFYLFESSVQPVTIKLIGRLSEISFEKPFLLTGNAKMSDNGQRIEIKIDSCVDSSRTSKSIPCEGIVRDYKGRFGIFGETFSPSFGAILAKTISATFSGMLLADLTESVTEKGVLINQSRSNEIIQGVSEGVKALGDEIAKEIRSEGRSIRTNGPVLVRVSITKDQLLW